MSSKSDPVDIDATYIHHTTKALLVSYQDEQKWIPSSIIDWPEEEPDFRDCKRNETELWFTVPRWFAEKEGFI